MDDASFSGHDVAALTYFFSSCWTRVRVDLERRKELMYLAFWANGDGSKDETLCSTQQSRMRAQHQTAI